jgi:hypothetical protein
MPSLSGIGPPARIVMGHPVWIINDSPTVASVRGSMSRDLDTVIIDSL